MNEAPFSVERIISGKQKFRVPIYQRLFVWEFAQIYQLLSDLHTARKSEKPYYIGVITVKARVDGEWEVVDGQQRITFLTLLGCELGWKDFVFAENNKSDLRIAYTGREQDQADIKSYFESKSFQSIINQNFIAFHNAFEEFKSKFRVSDGTINQIDIEQYADFVRTHCQFLVNQLPDNYGPFELNLYFEKMNSTGKQLTPVECIKGKYFPRYARKWNACLDFDQVLNLDSEKDSSDGNNSDDCPTLQEILEDRGSYKKPENDASGKLYSDRLVLFPEVLLLHVLSLTIKTDNSISLDKSKVIETFREAGDFDRELFIKNLIDYRRWLDANIIYLKNDNGTYYYQFRSDNDGADNDESKTNEKKKLRQIQSMLYVSSSDSQEWVLNAYKKPKKMNLFDFLKQEINKKSLPDVLSMKYPAIDRYWFWKLDYLLWEKVFDANPQWESAEISFCDGVTYELSREQIKAIKQYRFSSNRSIEHLHPQNPPTEGSEWTFDRIHNQDKIRNCFGNLCMISQEANSSLSNEPANVKFAKVENALQGHPLQSIKLMLMFACCKGKDSNWTPQRAVEHGVRMLKILGVDEKAIQEWKNEQYGNNTDKLISKSEQ